MILLTGGVGFIGRAICNVLGDSNVVTLDRQSIDRQSPEHITFELTASDKVDDLIKAAGRHKFTHVIHLAGITPWSKDPDFSLDLKMAETMAAFCNKLQIPVMLYMSGWVVYDTDSPAPYTEQAPTKPSVPYGQSKLAVEEYLRQHLTHTKLVAMRAASIYGPGQTSSGLIPNLVGQALRGEPISLNAKETKRDYLYIDDAARAIRDLTALTIPDRVTNLNIGSGRSVSVGEVAQTIQDLCKELYHRDLAVSFAPTVTEGAPIDNQLSIDKARSIGLLASQTPFKDGLRNYMQWVEHENIL